MKKRTTKKSATKKAKSYNRGGIVGILRNRGRQIDAAVDAAVNGPPRRAKKAAPKKAAPKKAATRKK